MIAVALKGLAVLLAAALGARLLRRAPASARHGVWAVAFGALALLPVLEGAGPRWSVAVWVAPSTAATAVSGAPPGPAPAASAEEGAAWAGAEVRPALASTPATGARPLPFRQWLVWAWAFGALAVGLGWLAAAGAAWRMVAGASAEADAGWLDAAERARRQAGLAAPVRLLRSDALDMPVAWGWGRGAVVLPGDADGWDDGRRHAVLLHEMAHLARRDAWSQAVAQFALAVHWANPLAWWGYRRFLDAREQACDDAVLRGGARPSAYASHLVAVARMVRRGRLALAAVAPMARTAPIESRVAAILDPVRQRRPLGRAATAATVVVAAAVCVPLAAFQPVAEAAPVVEAAPPPRPPSLASADTLDEPVGRGAEPWGEVVHAVETAQAEAQTARAPRGPAPRRPVPPRQPAAPPEPPATRPVAADRRVRIDAALADADRDVADAIAEVADEIERAQRAGNQADARLQTLRQVQRSIDQIDRQGLRDATGERPRRPLDPSAFVTPPVPPTPHPPPTPTTPAVPPVPASPAARPAPAAFVDWSDVDRARRAAQRRRSQ